jgi:hypothetical protein
MKSPAIPLLEAYATLLHETITVGGFDFPYYTSAPEGTDLNYILLRDYSAVPDDDKQTLSYSVDMLLEVVTSNKGGGLTQTTPAEVIDGIFNIILVKGGGFDIGNEWDMSRSRLVSQTIIPIDNTQSEVVSRHAILINHFIEEL